MQIEREVFDIDDNFVGQLNIESDYEGIILYPDKEIIVDKIYNVYALKACNIRLNQTEFVNTGIILNSIPRGHVLHIKSTIEKDKGFVGTNSLSLSPSPESNTYGTGYCHLPILCTKGGRYFIKYPFIIRLFLKIFFPRVYERNIYSHIHAGQKIGEFVITRV